MQDVQNTALTFGKVGDSHVPEHLSEVDLGRFDQIDDFLGRIAIGKLVAVHDSSCLKSACHLIFSDSLSSLVDGRSAASTTG